MLTLAREASGYRIASSTAAVVLSAAEYEDLFYAVPLSTTALYRLLVDTLCDDVPRRKAMAGMLEQLGGGLDSALEGLQKQVTALKP